WFPNGHKLLSGTPLGELAIWNGTHFGFEDIKRLPLGGGAITALKWSPKEDRLYAGDAFGQVMTLSEALNPLENQAFEGLSHHILDLSLSPFGDKLAACADACNPIVWDVETREVERYLRALHFDTNSTTCMEWHPEKALVATGSAVNWLYLWDPRTSEPVASELAHKRSIVSLRWNPNGTHLLTCSKDTLIKLWDLRSLKPLQTYHLTDYVPSMEGYTEPTAPSKAALVEPLCCSWNPIQHHIFAVGDSSGGLSYWSKDQSEKPLCYINKAHGGYVRNERDNHLVSLDWHPMGHLLATSSNNKYIRFWSRGPPGCIKSEMIDAFQLSEIDKSGSFPISRYLSHLSPQVKDYYASQETLSGRAKSYVPSNISQSLLPYPNMRGNENEQSGKTTASVKNKPQGDGNTWLKGLPKPAKTSRNDLT
ncbi:WD domain, G-beta repeat-containing protein, partial [Cardiosporidium cionae]